MSRPAATFPAATVAQIQETSTILDVNGSAAQIADVALSATYASSGSITVTASGTPFTNWPSFGAVQNLNTLEEMIYTSRTNNTLTITSANRAQAGTSAAAGSIADLMRSVEMRALGLVLNRMAVEIEAIETALRTVSQKNADYVILTSDNLKLFTNEGAVALIHLTLPVAAIGLRFRFVVQNVNGIQILPFNNGDTITMGNSVSSAGNIGGYVQSTDLGAVIELEAIGVNEWFATRWNGQWGQN